MKRTDPLETIRRCSIAALLMVAAACSPDAAPGPQADTDPLEMQALHDQLMVDPDLVNQNEGAAALTGSVDHSLPPMNVTRDAIAAAREEATVLVGGNAAMLDLPAPKPADERDNMASTMTALARAADLSGARECARAGQYGAIWAARLPDAMPIYPRGSMQDAAGADANGCALRSVNFLTPVSLEEVLAFYLTRAKQAGIESEYRLSGTQHAIMGAAAGRKFSVHAEIMPSGVTSVDLVTLGF